MEKQNEKKYVYARGRRKQSVAMLRLFSGEGQSTVNNKPLNEMFPTKRNVMYITLPLTVTDTEKLFHFSAKVQGGGVNGQCGAIRLALSRAVVKFDESYKDTIKKAGMLTRDQREKERKKPGLKKARKREQFSKR